MTTTLLMNEIPAIEPAPRRTITLQLDKVVLGQGVQTAEFERPDAEFEYSF